jgi:hypothetical protein
MIDTAILDQLRGSDVTRAIVADRVKLKREGKAWKGSCPFHGEKTGSFTVFQDGGWKCFGCPEAGFDAISYVERLHRVGFVEAARTVASARGIDIDTNGTRPPKNGKDHVQEEVWHPTLPPPGAPPPEERLFARCSDRFEYVGPDGRLWFYQRRWDPTEVEKQAGKRKRFAQLTYGTLIDKAGHVVTGWHAKGPQQQFPLYRLDRLMSADPDSFVIVVEGEGACAAAERMFPDHVVTTWLNGAGSLHLTDWEPMRRFKAERIIWWPDADKLKEKPHGCFISTPAFRKLFPKTLSVDTTGLDDIVDGFDAADLEKIPDVDPPAWLQERLRQPGAKITGDAVDPDVITLDILETEEIEPLRWIVPDLIPEGLTVLAGKPKIGKSWFMLCVALGLARGTEALGKLLERAAVLYCGLEDGKRRMQSRVRLILGPANKGWPGNFYFRQRLVPLDAGGLDTLEQWLIEHPEGRLIVIDVLAKVRGQKGRGEEPYQYDYRLMTSVQELALRYRVAIVIVHHVRKGDAEDVLDMISGTTGITGAADLALVLDRTKNGCRLAGRGRDTEDIDKLCERDPDTGIWSITGEYDEAAPDSEMGSLRRTIFDLLDGSPLPFGSPAIATRLNRSRGVVRKILSRMVKDGEAVKLPDGSFTSPKHQAEDPFR